jgi:uncharacterized protein YbbC (DUF1343 family)
MKATFKITFLFCLFSGGILICKGQNQLTTGASQIETYIEMLHGKKVGIVAHQASLVGADTHLVDTLLSLGINIKKVYAPEHGFRGDADDGESVADEKDVKTGLPILSLYGDNKKPAAEHLEGISVMLFDLQDVGVRFYTYLSTLHYVMEACAENGIAVILLDRPNPNTHYTDGPVLEEDCKSFVGMHPVPIVPGMTIGEYAQMINGERWLAGDISCDLTVVPLKNYTHQTPYEIPLRPSPNLPNAQSIALYPSLCLLEPTEISIGRGTEMQFQVFGHPQLPKTPFSFVPQPNYGAKNPKLKGQKCFGKDLRNHKRPTKIELKWLIQAYNDYPDQDHFFKKGFFRIAGNKKLEKQLAQSMSEEQIRKSWANDLKKFKIIREQYLIYP